MGKKKNLVEVAPVKLPYFHGMRPGKYILGLIVLALLLAVFFILFLPGIVRGGRYVDFHSSLADVGVLIDGKYLGSSTGGHYFIESGDHEVEYIKSGITVSSGRLEIDHPVFATLFVRRTLDVSIPVPDETEELYRSVYDSTLENLVLYAPVQDYDSSYNYPQLYQKYAQDAAALCAGDVSRDFYTLSLFASSQAMADDLEAAASMLTDAGLTFSSADPALARTLLEGGYRTQTDSVTPSVSSQETSDGFHHYESCTVTMGEGSAMDTLPVTVSVPAFEIAHDYVSEYDYALFIQENPYWAKENTDELIADGVADEYYLAGITLSVQNHSSTPVRNISWYAAQAYCDWLSARTGISYRLPSEAEWYIASLDAADKSYARSLVSVDTDLSSPASVMGGLWEFTSTAYVPLSRAEGLTLSTGEIDFTDVVVKGGSYINSASEVTRESVGVMPRGVTSDYAGFRLARNV